jgi:hypothetical protein
MTITVTSEMKPNTSFDKFPQRRGTRFLSCGQPCERTHTQNFASCVVADLAPAVARVAEEFPVMALMPSAGPVPETGGCMTEAYNWLF